MIYLDNAATTRPCPAALDAMRTALEDAWGNPSALYRPGQQARKLVEDARRTVARVLHAARPAEITFTSGGTESDVQALYTGAALGAAAGKRHIISTQIEHHAVLHTLQALQTQGFTVTLLPPSAAGLITPQQLADALQPDTCLVSIMSAPGLRIKLNSRSPPAKVCTKASVVGTPASATRPSAQIPTSFMVSESCLPNISAPTFPMNAVCFPSLESMASTLQGAPPGFASSKGFPCGLIPFSVKSISSSPKAVTSYFFTAFTLLYRIQRICFASDYIRQSVYHTADHSFALIGIDFD